MLRRFRFDPSTPSAPFAATLVDLTGLVTYFGIAALFLRGTSLQDRIHDQLRMRGSIGLLVLPDVERKLDAVAQTLFIENAADVTLHRSQTEVKLGGDLFVR